MKRSIKVLSVSGLLILALAIVGGSVAFAQGPRDGWGAMPPGGIRPPRFDADGVREALADALGMTPEALDEALQGGKSLFEIAKEQGVYMADVEAQLDEALAERIEQAVEEGTLTQEQADRLLGRVKAPWFSRALNWVKGLFRAKQAQMRQEALAGALDMSVEELQTALKEGKTIRQLAEERGISPCDLREAMEEAREEAIQQAVEEGRLTQEQADRLLARPGSLGRRFVKPRGRVIPRRGWGPAF